MQIEQTTGVSVPGFRIIQADRDVTLNGKKKQFLFMKVGAIPDILLRKNVSFLWSLNF